MQEKPSIKSILYKSETENIYGQEVQVAYSVEIDFSERVIRWLLYPGVPSGMHWKKGDEFGLGATHHLQKQSFDDFIHAPYDVLPDAICHEVLSAIQDAEQK